jgi:hypothetical protein
MSWVYDYKPEQKVLKNLTVVERVKLLNEKRREDGKIRDYINHNGRIRKPKY